MTYSTRLSFLAACALSVTGGLASWRTAEAQQLVKRELHRTPSGEILDFAPDGGWRVLARRVSAYRHQLLENGNFASLNAPMRSGVPFATPAAITGTKRIPTIMFRYSDVGTGATNLPTAYQAALWGDTPPSGRPYTIKSFYKELSNNLLTLDGTVIGWLTLSQPEANYTGGTNCGGGLNPYGFTNCNGIYSTAASTARNAGLQEALSMADTANFGLYDNDGPDGNPNSGDDDGFVDLMLFVHSEQDGACLSSSNGHMWSHKSSLSQTFISNDPRAGGGTNIRVSSYTIQSGVGGAGSCTAAQIMAIGTTAHETGHAFGLPDLYDTGTGTEGIGEWGLMGSGNYATPFSPSRMEAWSLNQLGWVTLRPITVSGTYSFGSAPISDSAFVVRVQGANPRKEYYFLENRQAVQSDSASVRIHCGISGLSYPTQCRGGLAIWHADSTKLTAGGNSVNTGSGPGLAGAHGLALVQADGRNDLGKTSGSNRGDAGDLWPGYGAGTPKNLYTFNSLPAAVANDSSTFVGFQIDQIVQVVPDGEMSFRLQFGGPTVVRALDTLARVTVDGTAYPRFAGLFANGSAHTINMVSPQVGTGGRSQYTFASWSDGGAQSHTITGSLVGDSITLNVNAQYKVLVTTTGTGTVASSPSVDLVNGAFLNQNAPIQLTATPGGGLLFDRWIGDTVSNSNPLNLTMSKPFTVNASFVSVLAVSSSSPPSPVMGTPYSFTFAAAGGNGSNIWTVLSGALPAGLNLTTAGLLSGTPTASGATTAVIRVASGAQTATTSGNLTVTEPALVVGNVLNQLLTVSGTGLSGEDVKYMDLLGNNNGGLDVGDFLAWVNRTNASPAPPAPEQAEGTVTP